MKGGGCEGGGCEGVCAGVDKLLQVHKQISAITIEVTN